ncbi:MAG: CD1247 N-terminal domain-containing protein [Eubacteriales bacterium]|jgi:ribosomal protein S27E
METSRLRSKVAYLQGLSAGLSLNEGSGEGRLIKEIIGVLDAFTASIEELDKSSSQIKDYLDSVDEDLSLLEDKFYDEEDELFDDTDYIGVECPDCAEKLYVDPEILDDHEVFEISCPNCSRVVFINEDNGQKHGMIQMSASSPEEDI